MGFLRKISNQKALRVAALLIADIIILNIAQFMALYVRYEFRFDVLMESGYPEHVAMFAPLYTVGAILIFKWRGLYNSLWAYVGMREAIRIGESVLIAGGLQYIALTLLNLNVPRSFPLLNIIFLFLLLLLERFSYRFARLVYRERTTADQKVRTMLIGAGDAGAMVLQEFQSSRKSYNSVVCIIDDRRQKVGMMMSGVPVVGGREDIGDAVKRFHVEEIIFAIPSCSNENRREILRICQQTGCAVKTLPSIADIANGKVTVKSLRKIGIEDLLGRDSVQVDLKEIGRYIEGKTVLVTGGGGSIGSELCRQVAERSPKELIIFDIYENNAYAIQQELRRKLPDLKLTVRIGSVRDKEKVEQLFEQFRPDIVYHAAAHKHVPLMEDSPNEAVKNNIFGTYNVAAAADRWKTETFVMISTDKAVNPTNVMGATKRVCEMIVQMYSRRSAHTRFVAVRFGNVLGSNGSVIPLFRSQIESGGPVTVTHKDVIRYFMTIPEAVSLVMQAGAYARGGEVFVLDMGEPVRIDDLARNMIRLSGYEPDVDIPVVYTGLRPGEKLFEELLMQEEGLTKTANELIFVGHPNDFSDEELEEALERLWTLSQENSDQIVAELAKLVKTYHPSCITQNENSAAVLNAE